MHFKFSYLAVSLALIVLGATQLWAGLTDARLCEVDKLKQAGKYASCRMKAEARALKKGESPDYSRCDTKLTKKFAKAETKWGAACATTGDAGAIQTRTTRYTDDLAVLLSGGVLPPLCGNGTVEAGEECDFGDLNGETCDSRTTGGKPLGRLACVPGTCAFDTTGCFPRFEDTGLTVIDHQTGLEWEKKTGTVGPSVPCPGGTTCGDPHHVNNHYQWAASGTAFNGAAKTLFLDVLNDVAGGGTNCFANHCDWRLPTSGGNYGIGPIQEAELESIVDCNFGPTCIDPVFGPIDSTSFWLPVYWASSTDADRPGLAWDVDFNDGFVDSTGKTSFLSVRAVRGGLINMQCR